MKGKPLSLEERKEIERLLKQSHTGGAIGRILGLCKTTINFEVRRNGGRENYCAKKAQEVADENKVDRYKKTAASLKGKDNWVKDFTKNIKLRIENLEMQIEILIDEVKSLRKGLK